MPNRYLREGVVTSEPMAAVSFEAETLWYRLLVQVDDFGLFDGRPIIIRSRCMPLRDVMLAQIDAWLADLARVGLIVRYTHDDKPYIGIPKFDQRTRAIASKFPLPSPEWRSARATCPPTDGQATDTRPPSAHGNGNGNGYEVDNEDGIGRASSRGSRLPLDWKPTPDLLRWSADARPDLDIAVEVESFRDYWHGVPGAKGCKADWTKTFRNWVRRAFARKSPAKPSARKELT